MHLPHVVDCHAHLESGLLAEQAFGLHQILARCERYAVRAVVCSVYFDLTTGQLELPVDQILAAAAQHESVRFGVSFGVCPPVAAIPPATLDRQLEGAARAARQLAAAGHVVAIGEVGLDYYWPIVEFLKSQGVLDWGQIGDQMRDRREPLLAEPRVRDCLQTQAAVFQACIELAAATELPLVIHGRDAYADILRILTAADIDPHDVMLHCFAGSVEEAMKAASRGFLISIPSSVGYRKKFADVAERVDLTRLVLETDSPYHSPFVGQWQAARDIARQRAVPDSSSRDGRKQWLAEQQLELFLSEVERRYPDLTFAVLRNGHPRVVSARDHLSHEANRRQNEPAFVRCAATDMATLKRVDVRDVCAATTDNARHLFPMLF